MKKFFVTLFILLNLVSYGQTYDDLSVIVSRDTVTIWDSNAMRNCSMQNTWDMYIVNQQITLYERDTAEGCALCTCIFDFMVKIAGLSPATYTAIIYQFYEDPYCGIDTTFIGNTTFTVGVKSDKDAPHIIDQMTTSCHLLVGVDENPATTDFSISPNPATFAATILYTLPGNNDCGNIILYNMQGIALQQYSLNSTSGSFLLPVTDLATGMYFLELRTSGQYSAFKRLMIIR